MAVEAQGAKWAKANSIKAVPKSIQEANWAAPADRMNVNTNWSLLSILDPIFFTFSFIGKENHQCKNTLKFPLRQTHKFSFGYRFFINCYWLVVWDNVNLQY